MKLSSSSNKDNNNNDYDSSKTDKELFDSYDGLLPRLFSLESLLTSPGLQLFQKIQSTNKVVPNAAWIFTALTIYSYIQHPLLKKYDFDIFEFAEGARSSYAQIVKSISSTDFSNFCNGYSTHSEDNLFLRDVVHPRIYSAAKESCQLILNKNQKFKLIDIDVTHFVITSVQVEIVDEASKLNEMQKNNEELEERNKVLEELINVVKEKEATTTAVTSEDNSADNNNSDNSDVTSNKKSDSESSSSVVHTRTTGGVIIPPVTIKKSTNENNTAATTPSSSNDLTSTNTTVTSNSVSNIDTITNNNINNSNNNTIVNPSDNQRSSSRSFDSSLNPSSDTKTGDGADLNMDPQEVDYPINSVLAHVQCSYRSIDTYEVIIDQSSPQVVNNVKFNTWTFTGCISGRIDLNWQLTKLE